MDISKNKTSFDSKIKSIQWYGETYQVADTLNSVKDFPSSSVVTVSSKVMMIVFANNQAFDKGLANYNKQLVMIKDFQILHQHQSSLISNLLMKKDLLKLSRKSLKIIKIYRFHIEVKLCKISALKLEDLSLLVLF